jgi:hypothetical protein
MREVKDELAHNEELARITEEGAAAIRREFARQLRRERRPTVYVQAAVGLALLIAGILLERFVL